MVEKSQEKMKTAFIIGPIGSANEPTRRRIDGLIAEVFRPILKEFGYQAVASHEESKSGSITSQIVEHLLNDDLVVCDLSQTNPNVMYELSVRHFINRPVVTVAEEGTKIPFDIGHERVLPFINDTMGIHDFKIKFQESLSSIDLNKKYDNPISSALNYQYFLKRDDKKPSSEDKLDFIIEKIKNLEELISKKGEEKTIQINDRISLLDYFQDKLSDNIATRTSNVINITKQEPSRYQLIESLSNMPIHINVYEILLRNSATIEPSTDKNIHFSLRNPSLINQIEKEILKLNEEFGQHIEISQL